MGIIRPSELIAKGFKKLVAASGRVYYQLDEECYVWDPGCGYLFQFHIGDIDALGHIEVICGTCKESKLGFKMR